MSELVEVILRSSPLDVLADLNFLVGRPRLHLAHPLEQALGVPELGGDGRRGLLNLQSRREERNEG